MTTTVKAAKAAIAGLRNTAVEATATAAGAYRDYADTLAVLFGEDWYLLEGMKHRDDEEKARLADLRKERAEFTAACKARGIGLMTTPAATPGEGSPCTPWTARR